MHVFCDCNARTKGIRGNCRLCRTNGQREAVPSAREVADALFDEAFCRIDKEFAGEFADV